MTGVEQVDEAALVEFVHDLHGENADEDAQDDLLHDAVERGTSLCA